MLQQLLDNFVNMIFTILLIILYSLIFSVMIWRNNFLSANGISKFFLIGFFLLKVVVGILYVWLHAEYFHGADLYFYFRDSQIVTNTLYHQPLTFLELTFGPNGDQYIPTHLDSYIRTMGFWGDSSAYMMVRINAIFNLFSFGHYYVNTVFMSFISFCAFVFILKILPVASIQKKFLPSLNVVMILFFPSVLFWCSGIHKETLVIFGVAMSIYCLSEILKKGLSIGKFTGLVLSLMLLYITRDFVFFLLIPCMIAFYWSTKFPRFAFWKFLSVYVILIFCGLFVQVPHYHTTFPELIQARHKAFHHLKGDSNIPIPEIESSKDVFLNVPKALYNSIFQPTPFTARNTWEKMMSIENSILLLLVLIHVFLLIKSGKQIFKLPLYWFCIFFSLSLYVIIGLIVPNLGALARYRSVPLLFLLIAISIPIQIATEQRKQKRLNN